MFLSASGNVAKQQRALQDAQATYNALPAPAAPSSAETELPALRTTRVTALATALGQRVAWDRLLREVSQVVPSDVWLLNLNAQSPAVGAAAAAAATPGTVTQTLHRRRLHLLPGFGRSVPRATRRRSRPLRHDARQVPVRW